MIEHHTPIQNFDKKRYVVISSTFNFEDICLSSGLKWWKLLVGTTNCLDCWKSFFNFQSKWVDIFFDNTMKNWMFFSRNLSVEVAIIIWSSPGSSWRLAFRKILFTVPPVHIDFLRTSSKRGVQFSYWSLSNVPTGSQNYFYFYIDQHQPSVK